MARAPRMAPRPLAEESNATSAEDSTQHRTSELLILLVEAIHRSLHHSSSKIASASIVISMMLLTTRPPRSMVSFQLTPKSWRLIEVLATKPARVLGPLSEPSSHQGVCHWPR